MKVFFIFLFGSIFFSGISQVPDYEELYQQERPLKDTTYVKEIPLVKKDNDTLIKTNDLLYREDQFYLTITYNLLQNKPNNISQNAFSTGISVGFIRDIPLNSARNIGIALGGGYSYNDYRTNLFISEGGEQRIYEVADDFSKNSFSLHFFEIPFELRWRTSTPKNTKFWRIYAGFKAGFLFYDRSEIIGDFPSVKVKNNPDLRPIRYATYLSVGHGGFNFYINYTLNPIFRNAYINGNSINLISLDLGVIFYFL